MKWLVVGAMVVGARGLAAAPFDGLFRPGATTLPCVGDGPREVTCAIERAGGARRSRLSCTAGAMHGDLREPFGPMVLVGAEHGIWRAGADGTIDRTRPAWLAIPPATSRWEEDDDPQRYSGTQHVTLAHERDWCAAWSPFGYGGAPKAYAVCVSLDGALVGIAAIKAREPDVAIRCGRTPEPASLLPATR